MNNTMDLDDPQQKELSYTDQQVYDKLSKIVFAGYPRSDPFPTDPNHARSMTLPLLTAVIALKSAKDDRTAYKQAFSLLDDPYQEESIVDEVRKAWEDGTLESLLDSGMWQSTKCCFVPHSCTARTYFPPGPQSVRPVCRQM
jgi:hypothetical protein